VSERVYVDLVADEILTARPSISFDVPAGTDVGELRRRVGVRGVDGSVAPTRTRHRFRWTPREAIAPGHYRLVVEALTDERRKRLTDRVEIPFTVVDTAARIPSRLRLESVSRIRLKDSGGVERLTGGPRPRGRYVEFFKATDRINGSPVELAVDQDGARLDPGRIVADYRKRTIEQYGRLAPVLDRRLRRAKATERLLVDIWLAVDEESPAQSDRPLSAGDEGNAAERAAERQRVWQAASRELARELAELGEVVAVDELAPVVTMALPPAVIRDLASQDRIGALLLHEEEGIDDLEDSIAVARSGVVHALGEIGSGIRVAVWENGPTSNDDLVIAARFESDPTTSDHSQNVHAIIRNDDDDSPDGHAPGCSLYSANDKGRAALRWAVHDQDCTIVNPSFHRSSEPGSDSLSSDDFYGDWLALHWPYPLIVHAAGNFFEGDDDDIHPPSSEYVNHKGFNTLAVGNHDDSASAMASSSVFRNPDSPHGDRELPEISANGTDVLADGLCFTGTSQASPAVAGIAALVQGTSSVLMHWPEGCRAILAAGASRNVRGDTWWRDVVAGVDARDGSGAVDAVESRSIALSRRWRGAPATRRGWDVGLLTSDDFGDDRLSKFGYQITVPRFWWGPRNVKVVLAWTSKVTSILGWFYLSDLTVDLDLKVFDAAGNQVAYSGSWDNSYEIAEFIADPGQTYTIRIRRWSGTDATWFGVAWTVTGGLLIPIPVELAETTLSRA
jgi:hypothetical protein